MYANDTTTFLRRILLVDAIISGATGLLMLAGAGLLEPVLGMPAAVLRPAGASLLPFAAVVFALARRVTLSRPAILLVIAANGLWVTGSVALVVAGGLPLTTPGAAFVLAQAVAVLAFAELQWIGLRRIGATMAAA